MFAQEELSSWANIYRVQSVIGSTSSPSTLPPNTDTMKYILFPLLLVGILFSFHGCKEDKPEPAKLELRFKARNSGNVAYLSDRYRALPLSGDSVRISNFKMYVADISLIKSDGTKVKIKDADYINFDRKHNAADLSADPFEAIVSENVPLGTYTGIEIGLGVNPANNAKQPSNFPSTDVLNNSDMYWSSWGSYIFLKLEGTWKRPGGGTGNIRYHTGDNQLYRTKTITNQNIVINNGQTTSLSLVVDINQLLGNMNLPTESSSDQIDAVNIKFCDNLVSAISAQ